MVVAQVEVQVTADVREVTYTLATRPGPHEFILVHHVFRMADDHPAPPSGPGIFMVHGDVWPFDDVFMNKLTPRHALAVYLAHGGVDVWGIDLAWTMVPGAQADLGFMAKWGLQHDLDDLRIALDFARSTRARAGADGQGLPLLGWSRGGMIGYAFVNEETRRPAHDRLVSGLIVADMFFKTDDRVLQLLECNYERLFRVWMGQGFYAQENSTLAEMGTLSETDPDGTSPIYGPPYTNRTASLTLGSALFVHGQTLTPWYHFVAGAFPNDDVNQMPTGLQNTSVHRWDSLLIGSAPYEPYAMLADAAGITCGRVATPFDDRLAQVRVPVLYVGAAGGIGVYGLSTLHLLGSPDVTEHIARLRPVGEEPLDFGHFDMLAARAAASLDWSIIADWLASRFGNH
jgi:hypothetical protein